MDGVTMKEVRAMRAQLRATTDELRAQRKLIALLIERLGGTVEVAVPEFERYAQAAIERAEGQLPDGTVVMRLRLLLPEAPLVTAEVPAELKRQLGLEGPDERALEDLARRLGHG